MIGKWHIGVIEDTPMEAWQERVIAEREQLQDKIDRLIEFFSSGKAYQLNHDEYALLATQCTLMKMYLEILEKRIKFWEE